MPSLLPVSWVIFSLWLLAFANGERNDRSHHTIETELKIDGEHKILASEISTSNVKRKRAAATEKARESTSNTKEENQAKKKNARTTALKASEEKRSLLMAKKEVKARAVASNAAKVKKINGSASGKSTKKDRDTATAKSSHKNGDQDHSAAVPSRPDKKYHLAPTTSEEGGGGSASLKASEDRRARLLAMKAGKEETEVKGRSTKDKPLSTVKGKNEAKRRSEADNLTEQEKAPSTSMQSIKTHRPRSGKAAEYRNAQLKASEKIMPEERSKHYSAKISQKEKSSSLGGTYVAPVGRDIHPNPVKDPGIAMKKSMEEHELHLAMVGEKEKKNHKAAEKGSRGKGNDERGKFTTPDRVLQPKKDSVETSETKFRSSNVDAGLHAGSTAKKLPTEEHKNWRVSEENLARLSEMKAKKEEKARLAAANLAAKEKEKKDRLAKVKAAREERARLSALAAEEKKLDQ